MVEAFDCQQLNRHQLFETKLFKGRVRLAI